MLAEPNKLELPMDTITSLEKTNDNQTLLRFIEALNDRQLRYYAQDWMKRIGYANMKELREAISPLIDAMQSTHVNTSENIKLIYRCDKTGVYQDWKLSKLGLTYLAFNAPHKNRQVRNLLLKLLLNYFSQNKA